MRRMATHDTELLPEASLRRELKATAMAAARTAGGIIRDCAQAGFRVELKDTVNLVTDADRRSEQVIIEAILAKFPDHRILAEEGGQHTHGDSPFQWIIDPLDGTTNFAHGYPAYCVSIGIEYEGRGLLGVVYDPSRDELFWGERGSGALLNNAPIRVSQTATLNQALLVTGFAYDIRVSPDNNLNYFNRFAVRAQGLRRTGTAALDLCYVACGRFDGFWELKLKPWDTAAGSVILLEAGGRMSDFKGGTFSIYDQEMTASNGRIHEAMLGVLGSTT
jgi:myo-inositol-1(or 4)-monophosphatase